MHLTPHFIWGVFYCKTNFKNTFDYNIDVNKILYSIIEIYKIN